MVVVCNVPGRSTKEIAEGVGDHTFDLGVILTGGGGGNEKGGCSVVCNLHSIGKDSYKTHFKKTSI